MTSRKLPTRCETQAVDLEPSARSGSLSSGGGGGGSGDNAGGGLNPGASPPSKRTLLGEAEDVLVKSWQAFSSANAAVLELVELQNPLPSSSRGGGIAAAVGGEVDGGMLLNRYCSEGSLTVGFHVEHGSVAHRDKEGGAAYSNSYVFFTALGQPVGLFHRPLVEVSSGFHPNEIR